MFTIAKKLNNSNVQAWGFKPYCQGISSVQSLSPVWLFATPWIAARQPSLFITNFRSLLRLMSIELVMPSSHLILCRPLLLLPPILPASGSFPMSQLFPWGGQSIGVSALASVLPMNTQDWSPSGWTGWISLQSKGLSRVFSNTTVQKHQLSRYMFQLCTAVKQIIPSLSDLKQREYFIIFHGFCGSEIWIGHRRTDLSLLHNIWGLSWKDLKVGGGSIAGT